MPGGRLPSTVVEHLSSQKVIHCRVAAATSGCWAKAENCSCHRSRKRRAKSDTAFESAIQHPVPDPSPDIGKPADAPIGLQCIMPFDRKIP